MSTHTIAMLCDICGKVVHPLDAHMGRINASLGVFHIECWNKHLKEVSDDQAR